MRTMSTTATTTWTTVDSPIGPLLVTAEDGAITRVWMSEQRHQASQADPSWERDDDAFGEVARAARRVLRGGADDVRPAARAVRHAVPARGVGGAADDPVRHDLLVRRAGRPDRTPGASRAVGLANGRNPISIIVPCHRVIGSTGHAHRLRRWARAQAVAARPRARDDSARHRRRGFGQ